MRLNRLVIVLIFCSSFSPLVLVMTILCYDPANWTLQIILFGVLILFFVLGLVTRLALKEIREQGGQPCRIVTVARSEKETLLYVLPFIAVLISLDITDPNRLAAFIFFVVLLSYFTVKNKSVFFNHVLAEQGYESYIVSYCPRGPGQLGKKRHVLALAKERPNPENDYQIFEVSENAVIINNLIPNHESDRSIPKAIGEDQEASPSGS